jgi:hypothetical protein
MLEVFHCCKEKSKFCSRLFLHQVCLQLRILLAGGNLANLKQLAIRADALHKHHQSIIIRCMVAVVLQREESFVMAVKGEFLHNHCKLTKPFLKAAVSLPIWTWPTTACGFTIGHLFPTSPSPSGPTVSVIVQTGLATSATPVTVQRLRAPFLACRYLSVCLLQDTPAASFQLHFLLSVQIANPLYLHFTPLDRLAIPAAIIASALVAGIELPLLPKILDNVQSGVIPSKQLPFASHCVEHHLQTSGLPMAKLSDGWIGEGCSSPGQVCSLRN